MLANKKPRGRPPKNARPAMDPTLRAAIIGQDNEQAEKENAKPYHKCRQASRLLK